MKAEIVAVGTELLLGEIVDTNSAYLAAELADLAIDLFYVSQVGDNLSRCSEVISRAWGRSDVILVTGGLGPTEDDLTREAIAAALNEELRVDQSTLEAIRAYFARRGLEMPPTNRKQAMLIPSATFIPNRVGTAPGWWVEKEGKVLVAMPGVPSEMRIMWEEQVRPRLKERSAGTLIRRVIKCFGIGESNLEALISDLVRSHNPTVATYAKRDGVYIRIAAKADTVDAAREMIEEVEAAIRSRLGSVVYGADDDTLPAVVGQLLLSRGWTLSVAESCTGGQLSSLITEVPGASNYFLGGTVAYTVGAKIRLGVPSKLIEEAGAVSHEVARGLALAARTYYGSSVGLGITGVAGPSAHAGMEPGTFFVAVDLSGTLHSERFFRPMERTSFKYYAALASLNLLRLRLLEHD
jgi:nicotinamide-nucleotide amidase